MSLDVLRSIINTVVVPITLLTASTCQNYSSKIHWVLWSVGLAAYVAYTYLTADWFFVGYYFRFVFLAGYVFVIAYSSVSLSSLPLFLNIGLREAVGILLLALFAPRRPGLNPLPTAESYTATLAAGGKSPSTRPP